MEINDLCIENEKPLDISKELEIINFKFLQDIPEGSYLKQDFKNWVTDKEEFNINNKEDDHIIKNYNKKRTEKTQFILFQEAMKILLACGLCLGLNVVSGILGKEFSKIRFVARSWILLYAILIAVGQTIPMCLTWYKLFTITISVRTLAYVCFYFSTWCTMIISFRIATKWPDLIKNIFYCNLDEYVDLSVIKRVKIVCIVSLLLALVEHLLSLISNLSRVLDCTAPVNGVYEEFIRQAFPWMFSLDVPFSVPLALFLQFTNLVVTFNWNYSDMFIVCTSLYLTSILNEINKKITMAADMNYLPSSIWSQLREDYTRATRLVRLFDEVFSGLIIISFASNLFFICLQLFNVLTNGLHLRQIVKVNCPNFPNGSLDGYISSVYLTYSLAFLVLRFLTVSLVAANVNVASTSPAAALYRIPACAYSKEVQRFVEQIHGDFVALSGMKFFYITRELVISVAGTIVTYELVLLQFNKDELSKN